MNQNSLPNDIQIYTNYMEEARVRISVIQALLEGRISTGIDGLNLEVIFLQFRKILEVIAFASLSANKEAYASAHSNFSGHWNAKRLQGDLEKVNPHYYPEPVEIQEPDAQGITHLIPLTSGFLTKDEFAFLYDACSEALHKPNPYKQGDPSIDARHSLTRWIELIQRLLSCHVATLVNEDKWIVQIPNEGPVQTMLSRPV